MRTPDERSPYGLMQEDLREQPWRLLVCCILLNLTSRKQAQPVWEELFKSYPTPELLHDDSAFSHEYMRTIFRPLGFQNRRTHRVARMTAEYVEELWRVRGDVRQVRVEDLYGIGKYAADSYNIFIKGNLVEDVQDKELKRYYEWAKQKV